MKFSVVTCILMGFWLNACTTEGEGSEFITKLASREEANVIMDYVNQQTFFFSSLQDAASGNRLFSVDSSRFNQIERQKQYYTYDPVAGHFKYMDFVSLPYSDSTKTLNTVRLSKLYYAASPHTANGLPSQPVYDLRYESSHYTGSEATYTNGLYTSTTTYDSLVFSVDEMPFVHLTQLDTMSLSAHFESFSSFSYTGKNSVYGNYSIEASFSLEQFFQSSSYGTTIGSGKLKFKNENLKYDLNVTLETEFDDSIQDPMIGSLTMYLDLAGFKYKQTETTNDWIPVD